MQEAVRIELQIELALVIQCGQGGDAWNSPRSKQNVLQVSAEKDEGFLELGMKSSCCPFSVRLHFLTYADLRPIMPDSP